MENIEIENPKIEKPKKGSTRDLRPDQASIVVAQTAGQLIGAQGSLNILNHLKQVFIEEDNNRRSNLPQVHPPLDTPESELEKFVKADYPSHLLKVAELENYIKLSKQSTKIIDETDITGAALWDFIDPEVQEEVQSQLEGLKSTAALKESLSTELQGLMSNTWQTHRETKPGTESERFQQYEAMFLGKEPRIKEKRDLGTLKDEILSVEEIHEMLTLEKLRLIMSSLTCKPEEKTNKEKEGFEVMGEEFSLVRSQIDHLEKMLEVDWLKSVPEEGISDPTKGESLICPELLARMKGKPSKEQMDSLNQAYSLMADKRFEGTNSRDKLAEKTAFCIASMEFLEIGKKAKFMNSMMQIRAVSEEKIEDKLNGVGAPKEVESTPDELEKQKEMASEGIKKAGKGVAKMIKACPAILAAQLWVMTKNKSANEYSGHYGSMADSAQFAQQLGLSRLDEPM